jgi:hypothetical protein
MARRGVPTVFRLESAAETWADALDQLARLGDHVSSHRVSIGRVSDGTVRALEFTIKPTISFRIPDDPTTLVSLLNEVAKLVAKQHNRREEERLRATVEHFRSTLRGTAQQKSDKPDGD